MRDDRLTGSWGEGMDFSVGEGDEGKGGIMRVSAIFRYYRHLAEDANLIFAFAIFDV